MSGLVIRFCASCTRSAEREERETPRAFEPLQEQDSDSKTFYAMACLMGDQFRVGDAVYLPPDSFDFR